MSNKGVVLGFIALTLWACSTPDQTPPIANDVPAMPAQKEQKNTPRESLRVIPAAQKKNAQTQLVKKGPASAEKTNIYQDDSSFRVVLSSRPIIHTPQTTAKKNFDVNQTPALSSPSSENVASTLVSATQADAAPLVFPPDSKVFDEEDLIKMDGRLLSPYSYLTANPQAKGGAPWDGEQLKFGIYYSFIKAGTAYIKNRGMVDIGGRPAYVIQTTAFSAIVIDAFFKVRDINQSWIDAQTYYSRGYTQSVREGTYKRDEWLTFDTPNKQFYGQMRKKEAPRSIKGRLETEVTDFLSSLYFVRAQKLVPGTNIVFDIINREKQYPLIVKVLGKDTVKTPAGKFNCIIVEPQIRGEGIFVSKGKDLKVWLTDDEYKMPVKMKAEVFIGSVWAELLEYKRN